MDQFSGEDHWLQKHLARVGNPPFSDQGFSAFVRSLVGLPLYLLPPVLRQDTGGSLSVYGEALRPLLTLPSNGKDNEFMPSRDCTEEAMAKI